MMLLLPAPQLTHQIEPYSTHKQNRFNDCILKKKQGPQIDKNHWFGNDSMYIYYGLTQQAQEQK